MASMEEAPVVFQPLPNRTVDRSAAYAILLGDLLHLVGAEPPALDQPDLRRGRAWRHRARRAVGAAVADRAGRTDEAGPVPDAWFTPLIRAAVHEPDPSFVRDLAVPTVTAYGRRRIRLALLDHVETGTAADAAGAARAWYPTLVPLRYSVSLDTPTPESLAERAKYHDLDRRYREVGLRRFVADDDLDVRRCLLPGLPLSPDAYPTDMHPLVTQAVEIARSSEDEYLRHRVEIQLRR
ncbi:hypothetical protein ACIBP4_12135 [Micromonospora maritima]|uniref:Uncharacterized protein n=1 Tax=Micromonospora maritima TaxID=986711 RepID=A0ABW7ZJJ7_9ACTN